MGKAGASNWLQLVVNPVMDVFRYMAALCCFVFAIIFVIMSTPVYLFRQVVILLAKLYRKDLGEIMNGQSSVFANELFEKRPPRAIILCNMTARGKFTIKQVEELVMKNWIRGVDSKTGKLKYEKFQQYAVQWLGFRFYKKASDTFNIKNHLFLHSNPGNKQITEDDIPEISEKLLNTPFKADMSPWEFHVINNYVNPKICPDSELTLLIVKIHHSLADGFSVMACIMEGFMEYPLSEVKIPKPNMPKRTNWQNLMFILTAPFIILKETVYVFSHNLRDSPWKVPDDRKQWYQHCAKSDPIQIQTVKDIKNAFGVSFSSVIVSAISAGINRHFQVKRSQGTVSKRTDLYTNGDPMLFLSALPYPGHNMRLTNHATCAIFDVPTVHFSSPIERLDQCHRNLEVTKTSIIPRFTKIFSSAVGCHFHQVGALFSKNRCIAAGLTNFPSFSFMAEHNGTQGVMCDAFVGGCEGSCGVAVLIMTYNQRLRICASAEKAVMSRTELNYFINCVEDELELLHSMAVKKKIN